MSQRADWIAGTFFAALLFGLTLLPLSSTTPSQAFAGGSPGDGPAKIDFKHYAKEKPKAPFDHHAHQKLPKLKCVKCHHTMKGAKPNAKVKKCGECHENVAEPEERKKQDDTPILKKAFHKRCKSCHKKHLKKRLFCPFRGSHTARRPRA